MCLAAGGAETAEAFHREKGLYVGSICRDNVAAVVHPNCGNTRVAGELGRYGFLAEGEEVLRSLIRVE